MSSNTLINHFARCTYQIDQIRAQALADKNCTLSLNQCGTTSTLNFPGSGATALNHTSGFLSVPSSLPGSPASMLLSPLMLSPVNPTSQLPYDSTFSQHLPPALGPDDSVSNISLRSAPGQLIAGHFAQSRRPSIAATPDFLTWNSNRQIWFENRLTRLTTSAGLPQSWIDNPEWIAFKQELIYPNAKLPSQKVLTLCIIPRLVDELKQQAITSVKGKNTTLQSDGWTGENHCHLITFMITADKHVRKFYYIQKIYLHSLRFTQSVWMMFQLNARQQITSLFYWSKQ